MPILRARNARPYGFVHHRLVCVDLYISSGGRGIVILSEAKNLTTHNVNLICNRRDSLAAVRFEKSHTARCELDLRVGTDILVRPWAGVFTPTVQKKASYGCRKPFCGFFYFFFLHIAYATPATAAAPAAMPSFLSVGNTDSTLGGA